MEASPRKLSPSRRLTRVRLRVDLIDEARRLDIDISQACERGLEKQGARTRGKQWLEENREAIESHNAWVEKHGLPLARYRQF
jgi:antitoxin CcdA